MDKKSSAQSPKIESAAKESVVQEEMMPPAALYLELAGCTYIAIPLEQVSWLDRQITN